MTSVSFSPDGKTIVSGSYDKTIKVWDAGAPKSDTDLMRLRPSAHRLPCLFSGTLALVEERTGDGATLDEAGEVAERDGATLRLKAGGAFYAPSPLQCVAVHWPRLVAGAQSGELYHLEVQ